METTMLTPPAKKLKSHHEIELEANDVVVSVDRDYACRVSAVLSALLDGSWKDSTSGRVSLPSEHITADSLKILFHPSQRNQTQLCGLTAQNVMDILRAIEYLQMSCFLGSTQSFLLNNLTRENLVGILQECAHRDYSVEWQLFSRTLCTRLMLNFDLIYNNTDALRLMLQKPQLLHDLLCDLASVCGDAREALAPAHKLRPFVRTILACSQSLDVKDPSSVDHQDDSVFNLAAVKAWCRLHINDFGKSEQAFPLHAGTPVQQSLASISVTLKSCSSQWLRVEQTFGAVEELIEEGQVNGVAITLRGSFEALRSFYFIVTVSSQEHPTRMKSFEFIRSFSDVLKTYGFWFPYDLIGGPVTVRIAAFHIPIFDLVIRLLVHNIGNKTPIDSCFKGGSEMECLFPVLYELSNDDHESFCLINFFKDREAARLWKVVVDDFVQGMMLIPLVKFARACPHLFQSEERCRYLGLRLRETLAAHTLDEQTLTQFVRCLL